MRMIVSRGTAALRMGGLGILLGCAAWTAIAPAAPVARTIAVGEGGSRTASGEPGSAFALAATEGPRARTLLVFAAASLSDAFREIARVLEARRPGLTVRLNFAGSQQLAAQIEYGSTADVFASADQVWMTYLQDRGLVIEGPQTFARNRLLVVVPKTNPARIRRLRDLARPGVKLVLGAEAVPVGRYSREVLRKLAAAPGFGNDYARRVLANLVSEEENVKSVVAKVQLGEADAGIVYRSDVPRGARHVQVLEIPVDYNILASYPIAVLSRTGEPEAARAFVDLVLSPQGQEILARHMLLPATTAAN